jgi:DNA mismatch repair protein MutL
VEEAYAGLLPVGRHPFGVVQVTLDPTLVDVNVHPTKREVRLRDEGRVFSAVQRACWTALQEARVSVAGARLPQLAGTPGPALTSGADREEAELELRDAPPGSAAAGVSDGLMESPAAAPAGQRLTDLAPLRPLAQTAEGWLVADSPRGPVLVDPHAAHEKILYTELMGESEAAAREGRPASSQLLLVDAVVSVEASALERLAESLDTLTGMGFELEPFGPGLVRCRAVPAAVGPAAPERLVRDLLDSLQDPADPATRRRRLAALIACHAAVRLGDRLGVREQGRLLERLVATPGGLTCPHGRPTVVVLDSRSLRQAFGRPAV